MTVVLMAANPASAALYALLQEPSLQTAIGGRLYDDIPEDAPRPLVLLEIFTERNIRGMGPLGPRELDVRTHTFSDLGSLAEARSIDGQLVGLLDNAQDLVIEGFQQCGSIVHHESPELAAELLNGVKVHEIVGLYTLWCEQVAA